MEPIPLVRRSMFVVCTDTIERLIGSPEKIRAREGVRSWQFGEPDDWVPFGDAVRTLNVAAGASGDPHFGLKVGEQHGFDELGAFGRMIRSSASAYEASGKLCRSIRGYNNVAHYWLAESSDAIWVCRAEPPGVREDLWQMEQYTLRQLVRTVQIGVGSHWRPSEVHLCDPRGLSLRDSDLFADTTIRAGRSFTAVAVSKALMARQLVSPKLAATDSSSPDDIVDSVAKIVRTLLPCGHPTLDTLGEVLGVRKRTLQRELARHGTSHRDVVNRVRFLRSVELLDQTDLSLDDIAHELGYAGNEKLIRAFRRWSGLTPGEFRRRHGLDSQR